LNGLEGRDAIGMARHSVIRRCLCALMRIPPLPP